MGVTFDTNVLLSATLWDGSVSQKLLFSLIQQNVKIYCSQAILSEYQKVLERDFDFSREEINEYMEKIHSFITYFTVELILDVVKEDPDDNLVLACAVASKSDYLITYDAHLLKLKEVQGTRIIRPEEARAIF